MPAEMIGAHNQAGHEQDPVVVSGELRCALTGRALSPEEAFWAPPLITTRQLVTTFVTTLFRAPGALGQVLLGDLPNVPYAPEARAQLASRRTVEQLKLLAVILLLAALLVTPILIVGA
jgi:hypothetical protein